MDMFSAVDTRDVVAVQNEVLAIYREMYPGREASVVTRAFGWARECFEGRYPGYQAVDARYHDFEHTLQGTLCLFRLLHGRHFAGTEPALTERWFQLTLLAILLHDTGYLKKSDDTVGTGAKYTLVHVARSIIFANEFLRQHGYSAAEVSSIGNLIRCTGVNVNLGVIPFTEPLEQTLGYALGTADLLGQMAAPDYVDKLPILFEEFAESGRYDEAHGGKPNAFSSAQDLMRKTAGFWSGYVLPKITNDFGALHRFLNRPMPNGPNEYLLRIEANLQILAKRLAA